MKGIILAAGKGTRLQPATIVTSKILLPVYDKPMIYYPLTTLIEAGVDDILVITSEDDLDRFKGLLGDGSQFGVSIAYEVQHVPRGIADAFNIAGDFIGGEKVILILGDNIYYADGFAKMLRDAFDENIGATIFTKWVQDPSRFGVAEIDEDGNVVSLEEKPKNPKSNDASTGLYIFDGDVTEVVKGLKPSARGELEVTDLDLIYQSKGLLRAVRLPEDSIWMDAGTFDSLLEAAQWVKGRYEAGLMVGSPEIAALELGIIHKQVVLDYISKFKSNGYNDFVKRRASE